MAVLGNTLVQRSPQMVCRVRKVGDPRPRRPSKVIQVHFPGMSLFPLVRNGEAQGFPGGKLGIRALTLGVGLRVSIAMFVVTGPHAPCEVQDGV